MLGLLGIEYENRQRYRRDPENTFSVRMRVFFYAEPINPSQVTIQNESYGLFEHYNRHIL